MAEGWSDFPKKPTEAFPGSKSFHVPPHKDGLQLRRFATPEVKVENFAKCGKWARHGVAYGVRAMFSPANPPFLTALLLAAFTLLKLQGAEPHAAGHALFEKHCVSCHAKHGEEVADETDEPLVGDKSVAELTRVIDRTMPKKKPETVDAEQAALIAAYIHDAFYSPAAQARLHPVELELSRLTVRQHQQSLADLIERFRPRDEILETGSLEGSYKSPDPKLKKNLVEGEDKRPQVSFTRRDAGLHFDWGAASPMGAALDAEHFEVEWNGCFYAEATGSYDFVIRSANGVRLFVNDQEEHPLIDEWVSAGKATDRRGTLYLLGERWYPIKLQFLKFSDPSASLSLEWQPPLRPREVIPASQLSPRYEKELFVASTVIPADDASAGYERGVAVSKAWEEACIQAAVETADFILSRFNGFTETHPGDADREVKVKRFLRLFAQRAFRRPLDESEAIQIIETPFKAPVSLEIKARRVLIHILSAPSFLYPELGKDDSWKVASRITLTAWDSMPSEALEQVAMLGDLLHPELVRQHIAQTLSDARAKSKLHAFFHHWLRLDRADQLTKDRAAFPDFDAQLVADLRTSLRLFLDDAIWSEGPSFRKLLLSGDVFVNARLAKYYGAPGAVGEGFERVGFDPRQRVGLLTQPLLLSALAYSDASSPIHRGVFLSRNLLGRALKVPTQTVAFDAGKFDPSLTMREKVTELTRPAQCMSCHATINPLGFCLEGYDASGRYRQMEKGKTVDTHGEYPLASGDMLSFAGARDLAEYACNSREAQRSFVEQLFQFMVKQPCAAYGPNTLDQLHAAFVSSGLNVRQLLQEIVMVAAMHHVGE